MQSVENIERLWVPYHFPIKDREEPVQYPSHWLPDRLPIEGDPEPNHFPIENYEEHYPVARHEQADQYQSTDFQSSDQQRAFYQTRRGWEPQMGHRSNCQQSLAPRNCRFNWNNRRNGGGRGDYSCNHGRGFKPNERFRGREYRYQIDATKRQPYHYQEPNEERRFDDALPSNCPPNYNAPIKLKTLDGDGSAQRAGKHQYGPTDSSSLFRNRGKCNRRGPALSNREGDRYDRRFARRGTRNGRVKAFYGKKDGQAVPGRFYEAYESPRRQKSALRKDTLATVFDAKLKVKAWLETCRFDQISTDEEFEDSRLERQNGAYMLMEESYDVKITMSEINDESSAASRASTSGGNSRIDAISLDSVATIPYPPERYAVKNSERRMTRPLGHFGYAPNLRRDYAYLYSSLYSLLPTRVNLTFTRVSNIERLILRLRFDFLPRPNVVKTFNYSVTRLLYAVSPILTLIKGGNFGVRFDKSVAETKVTEKSGRRRKKNILSESGEKPARVLSIDTTPSKSISANIKHPKKRYREWTASESASSADSRAKKEQILINSGSNLDTNSKIYLRRTPCPKKRFLQKERSRQIGQVRSPFKPENRSVLISKPIAVSIPKNQTIPSIEQRKLPTQSPTEPPTESATEPPTELNKSAREQTRNKFNNKPKCFGERPFPFDSGKTVYNKSPTYNYQRKMAEDVSFSAGENPTENGILNLSTNLGSGNSGPYDDGTTQPSGSYAGPDYSENSGPYDHGYSENLNAAPMHGQNRRGSNQPFYSGNFASYPNHNRAIFNCQQFIPRMVNFCLPPPAIFPNFSIPLYQPPSNGNVFVGCPTSFRFPDPVHSNRVNQTMPYSSLKEVEMETVQEDSVAEAASPPVAAPDDMNQDSRIKPRVRNIPEEKTENKAAIEADFAKPLSYTYWRKPAPILGITKPFYRNPKKGALPSKTVNDVSEDPRRNSIREIKRIVSGASNNDPRWRFVIGPDGRKIKFRIGDFAPKCNPFVDPERGDSSMTKAEGHPPNPNASPSSGQTLTTRKLSKAEREIGGGSKTKTRLSPQSPSNEAASSSRDKSKRRKKTATVYPSKKVQLISPLKTPIPIQSDKMSDKTHSVQIADQIDSTTRHFNQRNVRETPDEAKKSKNPIRSNSDSRNRSKRNYERDKDNSEAIPEVTEVNPRSKRQSGDDDNRNEADNIFFTRLKSASITEENPSIETFDLESESGSASSSPDSDQIKSLLDGSDSDDTDIYYFNSIEDAMLDKDTNVASSISPPIKAEWNWSDDGSNLDVTKRVDEKVVERSLDKNNPKKHISKSSHLFEELKRVRPYLKRLSILDLVSLRERLVEIRNENDILIEEARLKMIPSHNFARKLLSVIANNCQIHFKEVEFVLFNYTPNTNLVKRNLQSKMKKEENIYDVITLSSDSESERASLKSEIKTKTKTPSNGKSPESAGYSFSDCLPVRISTADLQLSPNTKFYLEFDQLFQTPIESSPEPATRHRRVKAAVRRNLFAVEDDANYHESIAELPTDVEVDERLRKEPSRVTTRFISLRERFL